MIIKSKSSGIDLFSHSEAVKDTAYIFNAKGGFNLDRKIIRWMCILHDLGKANPLFQSNMDNQDFTNVCRHEISSILFIDCVPDNIKDVVALSILSHHKSINNDDRSLYKLLDEQEDVLFKNHINNIEEWGNTVKKYLYYHYDIEIEIPSQDRCVEILEYYFDLIENINYGYSLYRGLLMMADHFASCFENNEERLNNISKLFEIPNINCYESKNEKYPLSLIDSNKEKKHTLCVAPTGVGKTNFMMKRTNKRVFYTLPYQASINAMYSRINNDIGNDYLIGLKHNSINSISFIDERIKTLSSFYGMSVKVITPFQIMGVILRLKGYESLILDLQGQDVIFDELHTYNSMTKYYILSMIKFLVSLDCNIHVCTATMPSWMQKEIINILGEENTQIVKLDNNTLDDFNRHIVHTEDTFNIYDIKERYERGEKILIVRNQVKLSIDTYVELKNYIKNCKIMLIHSRFKRSDRALKEQLLLNHFNGEDEPCIVVSTQVVEVSIDINFDVMYTDNADIMSLIQRFGRINRQRKNIGVLKDVYVVKNQNGSELPYDIDICEKTFEVLSQYNNKVLEEKELQNIIDYVHPNNDDNVYENSNPFDNNGEWKQKMFSNVINTSLSKELEFEGYIGILESDLDEYMTNMNKNVEIPLSHEIKKFKSILNKNGKEIGYIIPTNRYSYELGCII
jgi:CRISPR-associated endonuclease/helicase Cas3